jgi:hypothetical protein
MQFTVTKISYTIAAIIDWFSFEITGSSNHAA